MRRLRLLTALLIAGCSQGSGIRVPGELLAAVNMHLHTGEWDQIPPGTQEYLASRFPFPLSLNPEPLAEGRSRLPVSSNSSTARGLRRGSCLRSLRAAQRGDCDERRGDRAARCGA